MRLGLPEWSEEQRMIQSMRAYHIRVGGELDEGTFNAKSPLQVKVIRVDMDATVIVISADQSGLIGLIRYLHGQGFVLLSIDGHAAEKVFVKENETNE